MPTQNKSQLIAHESGESHTSGENDDVDVVALTGRDRSSSKDQRSASDKGDKGPYKKTRPSEDQSPYDQVKKSRPEDAKPSGGLALKR
jgi:hypothetical protein